MLQQLHLKIYGRVQGVWFRASAKKAADKLQLTGWTRNCIDGSVEVLAEGNRTDLEKFLAWCRNGPELAKVEKVEFDFQISAPSFHDFQII